MHTLKEKLTQEVFASSNLCNVNLCCTSRDCDYRIVA